MIGLGDLPGGNFSSIATAVSADGSIVVGSSAVAIGDGGLDVFAPFLWDAVNGMRDLRAVFAELGWTLPYLTMTNATDISDDGRTITGFGKSVFRTPAGDLRTEAWVGVLPPPSALPADFDSDGDVDGDDFLVWQANFGTPAGAAADMGDADGDGDVDGDDFLVWQAQFGSGVESAGSSVPVPEPDVPVPEPDLPVPEPDSLFLLFVAAACPVILRGGRVPTSLGWSGGTIHSFPSQTASPETRPVQKDCERQNRASSKWRPA